MYQHFKGLENVFFFFPLNGVFPEAKTVRLLWEMHSQVAGITKPVSEISPSVAEEALEQVKNRITALERESQDLKFKVVGILPIFE